MAKRKKRWIQGAIKRPGDFTAWCKEQGYAGANASCIAHAKRHGSTRRKRQAALAARLKKMPRRRKKRRTTRRKTR